MAKVFEVIVSADGSLRPLGEVDLPAGRRLFLSVVDDQESSMENSLLSQQALAEDWETETEDAAWAYLQE